MHYGFDIDEVLQDVKNSVDAIYSFPAGAEKPTVQKQKSRGMGGMGNMVGYYALNGPDDLWKLKEKADKIKADIAAKVTSLYNQFRTTPQFILQRHHYLFTSRTLTQ